MEISRGIIKEPHFVLIFGVDKVGKTTFAAQAPKSVIVGPESGSNRIDVARAKGINTFTDVLKAIKWLRNEKHDFQSLGLDSLDWIEPTLWKELCDNAGVKSIEDFGGGYGKGYTAALSSWSQLIDALKDLRSNRNMNIVVIAHSQVKTVNDPMVQIPYDRHILKLNEKAGAKWREAVDAILFAAFEDTVFKANKGDKKGKTEGEGVRKLYTVRRAAFDAGNRLGLPSELPLSYSAFADAAEKGTPDSTEQVSTDLVDLLETLRGKDPAMSSRMEKAIADAGTDTTKLIQIRNHARVLVEAE